MKMILFCLMVFMMLGASACSQRAWYESVKQGQRNECYKYPPSAREECLKAIDSDSYDEYQRKKQDAAKKDN